jgi:molybdopterin/thiamine biosynthesis adenylyltransferase
LQRQILFDEEDIKAQLPKAVAAERHLKKVNSSIEIEGIVADVNYTNIEKLVNGFDLIMDGLDNLETRFLINDVSLKHDIPWIYGGAVSSMGMTMTILPHKSPCLQCFSSYASGTAMLNCDTSGVISPAPIIVASLQCVEAIKLLVGADNINQDLLTVDVWNGEFMRLKLKFRSDCPSCHGKYEFLDARFGTKTTSLCGQNSVQVLNTNVKGVNFAELAARLEKVGEVSYSDFLFNFTVDSYQMVIFTDGRAIVKDTADESLARGLYAKYIGT